MNLLLESLPDKLSIGENTYPIKTDFRTWMRINEMLVSEENTDEEIYEALFELFDEDRPNSLDEGEEIMEQISWFLRCGKEVSSEKSSKGPVTFSFTYDSDYILSAFQEFYRIDLTESNMHWWKFVSLLNSISGDCELKERVRYRGINVGKIKDPKERARIRSIQRAIALPNSIRVMTDEEIGEAIW